MSRYRRSRRRCARPSPEQQLLRIEKGEDGERALQEWLDRSRLAYVFLDQTPLTIPIAHRAHIKRPDFLVAVDGLGTIAVDAKAKSFIEGCFVIDASERRRLDGFESIFGIPVWYACFPPEEEGRCYLFRNRDLVGRAVSRRVGGESIGAPIALTQPVQHLSTLFARALLTPRPPP
jgi:hypothetical protein